MPPLRPSAIVRYAGYVCPSCTGKITSARPLWLSKPSTIRQYSDKPTKRSRTKHAKSTEQSEEGRNITVNYFDETPAGIVPGEKVEDMLQERINTLEAQLKQQIDGVGRAFKTEKSEIGGKESEAAKRIRQDLLQGMNLGGLSGTTSKDAPENSTWVYHDLEIPKGSYPENRRGYIIHLNAALSNATAKRNKGNLHQLWKCYSKARETLSLSWSHVPDGVWKFLWQSFSLESIDNLDRMAHILQLGNDIEAASVPLQGDQLLLYIEAMFLEKSKQEGFQLWESRRTSAISRSSTANSYWSLGTRMLIQMNKLTEAQETADILLNGSEEGDPQVLIPLMAALLSSSDFSVEQKVWALYIRFRIHRGEDITMDDYDACIGVFLSAERADFALAIFKDMMITHEPKELRDSWDSVAIYRKCVVTTGSLRTLAFDPAETAWKSAVPLTRLPRKHNNKFFFGSWLKKLLGEDEIEWAEQVVDLMYRRGITADSRYLNGIIGARLRRQRLKDNIKAEELAWRMIRRRVEIVKGRVDRAHSEGLVRATTSDDHAGTIKLSGLQNPPPATLETFSILAENYRIRQKKEQLEDLFTIMQTASIRMDISFLNTMLKMAGTNERKQWAWSLYEDLVKKGDLTADHGTFAVFWKIMMVHYDPLKNSIMTQFPTCRTLFAEMVEKAGKFSDNDTMSQTTYMRVIKTFGLADDQIGTSIALRAMGHYFRMYPDEETIRSVVLQLAKIGQSTKRLNLNSTQKVRIREIMGLFQQFKEERAARKAESGAALVLLSKAHDASEENDLVEVLCDVLKFVVESRVSPTPLVGPGALPGGDKVSFTELARVASLQMGIPAALYKRWYPAIRAVGVGHR